MEKKRQGKHEKEIQYFFIVSFNLDRTILFYSLMVVFRYDSELRKATTRVENSNGKKRKSSATIFYVLIITWKPLQVDFSN